MNSYPNFKRLFCLFGFVTWISFGIPVLGWLENSPALAQENSAPRDARLDQLSPSPADASSGGKVGPALPGVPNPHGAGGVPTAKSPSNFPPSAAPAMIPPQPPAAGTGKVQGQLVNKSGGDARLEEIEVRLFVFENQIRLQEWNTVTDPGGSFWFESLNTGPALRYIVSALFQGVVYLSEGRSFAEGQTQLDYPIEVYESGPAPGNLSVSTMHFIVQVQDGLLTLTEVMSLTNPDKTTLLGASEGTLTLALDVPEGAYNVEVHQGFFPNLMGINDQSLVYNGPIFPGDSQVVFSYTVPAAESWLLRRRLQFPVGSVDVFVDQNGPSILSSQLSRTEPLNLNGHKYQHYTGGPFTAGAGFMFQIGGATLGNSSSKKPVPATPIAVAIGFCVVLMVIRPFLRKAASEPLQLTSAMEAKRQLLLRERDRELDEVREIDFDFSSGKLSDEDHQALRSGPKLRAIEIMAQLETLELGTMAPPNPSVTLASVLQPPESRLPANEAEAGSVVKYCTACGAAAQSGDRFCGGCGERLRAAG